MKKLEKLTLKEMVSLNQISILENQKAIIGGTDSPQSVPVESISKTYCDWSCGQSSAWYDSLAEKVVTSIPVLGDMLDYVSSTIMDEAWETNTYLLRHGVGCNDIVNIELRVDANNNIYFEVKGSDGGTVWTSKQGC